MAVCRKLLVCAAVGYFYHRPLGTKHKIGDGYSLHGLRFSKIAIINVNNFALLNKTFLHSVHCHQILSQEKSDSSTDVSVSNIKNDDVEKDSLTQGHHVGFKVRTKTSDDDNLIIF